MKKSTVIFTAVMAAALLAIVIKAWAVDVAAQTIRYRLGTVLTFDATTKLTDEDTAWGIDYSAMTKLASVGASNYFTGKVLATVGYLAHSNTLASLPTLTKGDVFLWSSNGVGYLITSAPDGTLATNKLGP